MRKDIIITVIQLVVLLLGVLFFGIYFYNGETKYNKMCDDFTERRFNGLVVKSIAEGRGFYLIEINDEISDSTLQYTVPKSWFFKNNDIKIGDSVCKKVDSRIMTFYKRKSNVYEKCCEYELER